MNDPLDAQPDLGDHKKENEKKTVPIESFHFFYMIGTCRFLFSFLCELRLDRQGNQGLHFHFHFLLFVCKGKLRCKQTFKRKLERKLLDLD